MLLHARAGRGLGGGGGGGSGHLCSSEERCGGRCPGARWPFEPVRRSSDRCGAVRGKVGPSTPVPFSHAPARESERRGAAVRCEGGRPSRRRPRRATTADARLSRPGAATPQPTRPAAESDTGCRSQARLHRSRPHAFGVVESVGRPGSSSCSRCVSTTSTSPKALTSISRSTGRSRPRWTRNTATASAASSTVATASTAETVPYRAVSIVGASTRRRTASPRARAR